jgi:hypothetical protein
VAAVVLARDLCRIDHYCVSTDKKEAEKNGSKEKREKTNHDRQQLSR